MVISFVSNLRAKLAAGVGPAAILLWAVSAAQAQDIGVLPGGQSLADMQGRIQSQIALKDPFVQALKVDGQEGMVFASRSGRYVVRGVMLDVWTGDVLNSVGDIERSMSTLNLANLNLDPKDVDPLFYGSGPEQTTLFVDPKCPYCKKLFEELISDPYYAETFTFTIYVVPFLGDESARATTVISCHENRDDALDALLTADYRWMRRSENDIEDCDKQPILQRMIMAQMLGVTGVPFLIAPNGKTVAGLPSDIPTFFDDNME